MHKAIESEEYKGYTINIYPDDFGESPRHEWSNFGTMVCFNRRHGLGDKHGLRSEDFTSWDDVARHLIQKEDAAVILPLYLYDHSGLRMKVGSFNGLLPEGHAEFDSCQVGFIYISRDRIREEYDAKRVTKNIRAKAAGVLENEVAIYDQYLSGQVYGFIISDAQGDHFDSCWGYYSDPSEIISECKATIDHHLESIPREYAEQLILTMV